MTKKSHQKFCSENGNFSPKKVIQKSWVRRKIFRTPKLGPLLSILIKQNREKRPKNRSFGKAKRGVAPRRTKRMKNDGSRILRDIGRLESDSLRSLIPK